MEKTRHFIVDTPVGQLAIYAKHDKTDCAADYANEGARTKIDELKKVKFSKRSNKAAQGDKSLTVDVDMMIVGGVYQDGVAPV